MSGTTWLAKNSSQATDTPPSFSCACHRGAKFERVRNHNRRCVHFNVSTKSAMYQIMHKTVQTTAHDPTNNAAHLELVQLLEAHAIERLPQYNIVRVEQPLGLDRGIGWDG